MLGLTNFASGDYILKRNGTGYSAFTNISGVWYPSTPSLALGEAVIINCSSNTSWSQTYQNLTNIDVYALSPFILDFWYNDENNHSAGGGVFFYCDSSEWDVEPRDVIVPDDAICELSSVYFGNVIITCTPTGDLLDGEGQITFLITDDFMPGDQGDYVRVRYKNGNVCGPWSNPLSNGILPW